MPLRVRDVVNAQSINNKGLVVGFYVGNDGQDHGFMASEGTAKKGTLTGTAIADPTIPTVAGEPGATFVFSQVLSVNDHGIAVGYYGDSTTSQHGFIYNTHTGQYTFLDDPSEAFDNGVEVTQITGITNSGEITGFYSDANGVVPRLRRQHGIVSITATKRCVGVVYLSDSRLFFSCKGQPMIDGWNCCWNNGHGRPQAARPEIRSWTGLTGLE